MSRNEWKTKIKIHNEPENYSIQGKIEFEDNKLHWVESKKQKNLQIFCKCELFPIPIIRVSINLFVNHT